MANEQKVKNPFRIIFMGTPDFAAASLEMLYHQGFHLVAVITAPDKPAGRGMQLQKSAVKNFAEEKQIPVLQPSNLKSPSFIKELQSYHADLQVVVAFRMLPEIVWDMPPQGTVNLHASLLPQYRGAAPINHAIIEGEKETGVTIFKLKHEIDTGNILAREKTNIGENETAGELHDRLKLLGAKLLAATITKMQKQDLPELPQETVTNTTQLKRAPKIFKKDCFINWHTKTEQAYNFIRGLSPYPAAHTLLQEKTIKIFSSKKELQIHNEMPGTVHTDGKTYLKFACTDGFIHILSLQAEGKKRMPVEAFLKGYREK